MSNFVSLHFTLNIQVNLHETLCKLYNFAFFATAFKCVFLYEMCYILLLFNKNHILRLVNYDLFVMRKYGFKFPTTYHTWKIVANF